jgi:hypothetical protein
MTAPRSVILMGFLIVNWGTVMNALAFNGQKQSASPAPQKSERESQHEIYGTIRSLEGSQLTIETRDKRIVKVDATAAVKSHRLAVLEVGRTIIASGLYDAKQVLHAERIQRAKAAPEVWPADY